MGHRARPKGQRLSLREGFERSGLSLEQVWVEYLAMGGMCLREQVASALRGEFTLERYEHSKLAAALNEFYTEAGLNHPVAYDRPPQSDAGHE